MTNTLLVLTLILLSGALSVEGASTDSSMGGYVASIFAFLFCALALVNNVWGLF